MVSVFATEADAECSSLRITSLQVQAFFYDDDFARWVVFACSARFGDFASHVGRASAQVARDLFYRQLAGGHVTEVNEILFGPARPDVHVRSIEGDIFARELTARVVH